MRQKQNLNDISSFKFQLRFIPKPEQIRFQNIICVIRDLIRTICD